MFIKMTVKEEPSCYVAFEVLGRRATKRPNRTYDIRVVSTSKDTNFKVNQLLVFNPDSEDYSIVKMEILDYENMSLLYSDVAPQRQSLPPEDQEELISALGL